MTDERHVPLSDPASNCQMLLESFIAPLKLEEHFVFPEYFDDFNTFCDEFRKKLDVLNISGSLAILGVGTDGHTASLYPGQKIEKQDRVTPVESGHDALARVSLSDKELHHYKYKWFLANTNDKLSAVHKAVKITSHYEPIKSLISENTIVFTQE